MDMYPVKTYQSGLSLIGVVASSFLLISGIIAVTGVLIRSQAAAASSRDQFVAVSLAREGLELVQAVRDNNWFAGNNWVTNGICDNSFASNRSITVDRSASGIVINSGGTTTQLYIDNISNVEQFTHTVTARPSRYRRELTIDCSQKDASLAQGRDMIEVESRVVWQSRHGEHSAVVKMRLFNWY